MIHVLIKASSNVTKAGLRTLLSSQPALELIEDRANDAWTIETEPPADVWLVETETLADSAAREAADWAAAGWPVVLLVRNPAAESLGQALRAGVKAILPTTSDAPEIAAAIQAAAAGLLVLHPASIEPLLPSSNVTSGDHSQPLAEALTSRELEVLRLVAAGLGNKEIAARLKISDHTVKFHVASIMGKLGAGSRTEAVTLGIRHGLILI